MLRCGPCPDIADRPRVARATRGVDYLDAVQRRHEHTRRLTTFFERLDLLLTPTPPTPPPPIGAFDLPVALQRVANALLRTRAARLLVLIPIVDDMVEQDLGWVPYTQLANLTGRPAISLPLNWTAEGAPLGVQFVSPLGGEGVRSASPPSSSCSSPGRSDARNYERGPPGRPAGAQATAASGDRPARLNNRRV